MNKKIILLTHLILAICLVSLVGLPAPSVSAGNAPIATAPAPSVAQEVYTGNLIYFGGTRGSITTTFTLTIDSYTPDDEVLRLTAVLKDGKQDALLRTLSNQKRGRIQIGTNVGRDLNAVWVSKGEEGERKITGLSERWIGVFERRRGTRSIDYPYTYIELFVDEQGKGDGGMIPAARVRYIGDRTIEVENFEIYPARLTNVRRRS